jgi:hypothetical protein
MSSEGFEYDLYTHIYIYIHIYIYTYIHIYVYVYRELIISNSAISTIVGTGTHGFNGDGSTGPKTQIGHLYVHILDFII